ncbi:helix-turn-helix domain-containing protein [Microlunatus speluncae]|uniref:helix-turn-helix domain-containing protein n=1 Tax=Microlunatus speluncae TaxID=2594267 RepID=UPI0012665EEF|nr:helix-turn-helix domain-containing protein [Microlunatus speluncae]
MTELLETVVPRHSIRFLGHDEHSHEVPHLVHLVRGSARLTVDGEPIRLRQGESVWLAAEVPHAMRLTPGSLAIGPMLSPGSAPAGTRVRRLGVLPALTTLITTILGAAPETPAEVLPFRRALEELLGGLDAEHFAVRQPVDPIVRRLADEAAAGTDTLDRIAARNYLSVRQAQRMFLDETGLPFTRWRTRTRLNRAVAALRAGESLDAARRAADYATRTGLLRALSRETGRSERDLAADPLGALQV